MSKKILYLIDSLNTGGTEKSILEISKRLNHYKVIIVTLFQPGVLSTKYKHFVLYNLNAPNWTRAFPRIIPIISKESPDIIYSNLFYSDILSRIVKFRFRNIYVINGIVNNSYSHDRYSKLPLIGKLKLKIYELLDLMTAVKVDYFLANSETIRKAHIESLNLDKNRIKTIYRGRTIRSLKAKNGRKEDIFGVSNNTMVLLGVGRLLERKGFQDVISGLHLLLKSCGHFKIKLAIAGEGYYEKDLRDLSDSLHLSESVTFLGLREDIDNLMVNADIFVFPSWYEGHSGTLIEAMVSGIPSIVTNIPENLESVDSDSAILVDTCSPRQIANAIEMIINDPKMASDLGINAREKAKNFFDIDVISAQHEEFYDSIINQN